MSEKKKVRMNEKIKKLGEEIAREFVSNDTDKYDPLGSWTGTPRVIGEKPEQDVDDL